MNRADSHHNLELLTNRTHNAYQRYIGYSRDERDLDLNFGYCDKEGNLPALQELVKVTQIPISHQLVQKTYNQAMLHAHLNYIQRILWLTGIKPQFKEEYVQQTYKKCLEGINNRSGINGFGLFQQINELTGIMPKVEEELVQKVYTNIIKGMGTCFVQNVKILEKLTGVKVNLSEEMIREVYESGLDLIKSHIGLGESESMFENHIQTYVYNIQKAIRTEAPADIVIRLEAFRNQVVGIHTRNRMKKRV